VYALAHALKILVEQGNTYPTGMDIFNVLTQNVSFMGLTGNVTFDPVGDRIQNYSIMKFDIANISNPWQEIGSWSPDGSLFLTLDLPVSNNQTRENGFDDGLGDIFPIKIFIGSFFASIIALLIGILLGYIFIPSEVPLEINDPERGSEEVMKGETSSDPIGSDSGHHSIQSPNSSYSNSKQPPKSSDSDSKQSDYPAVSTSSTSSLVSSENSNHK